MPGGGRLRSYRLGDRSELLVQHLLSGVAFTTPVPRQEDIGVDFLCSLITGLDDAGLLRAGPFFTVQAKSNVEAVVYHDPHQLEWIKHQENFCFALPTARRQRWTSIRRGIFCGVWWAVVGRAGSQLA